MFDLGKCPNRKMHESESAGFLVLTETLQKKIRSVIIKHLIRKLLSELIFDLGKYPNQKTQESESEGFLVLTEMLRFFSRIVTI